MEVMEYDELNQLSVEQNIAFRRMMGRWRSEVLEITQNPWFWAIVECVHESRGPCIHLSAFLKQRIDEQAMATKGNHLCQLANGKALEIANGFNDTLVSSKWWEVLQQWPLDRRERLALLSVSVVLAHAGGFDRRVLAPFTKYPLKLLTLAASQPDTPCKVLQETCSSLINDTAGVADATTRKFCSFFKPELTKAATEGICPPKLRATLVAMRSLWRSDTRENERINKMIGIQGDRSPNISLELLSGRIALKHYLGAALSTHEHCRNGKWSTSRPVAAALLNTCLEHAHGSTAVLENPERWAPPLPAPLDDKAGMGLGGDADSAAGVAAAAGPEPSRGRLVAVKPSPGQLWATTYSMLWNRKTKGDPCGLSHCLAFERDGLVEGPVFLRAGKVYSLGWMASAAPITTEGILEGIKVHVPLRFCSSVDMFEAWYDTMQNTPEPCVAVRKYYLKWDKAGTECICCASIAKDPLPQVAFNLRKARPKALARSVAAQASGSQVVADHAAIADGGMEEEDLEAALCKVMEMGSDSASDAGEAELEKVTELFSQENCIDELAANLEEVISADRAAAGEDVMQKNEADILRFCIEEAPMNANMLDVALDRFGGDLDHNTVLTPEEAEIEAMLNAEHVMGNTEVLNAIAAEEKYTSASDILYNWVQNVTRHMSLLMAAARSQESVNLRTTTQLSLVAHMDNNEPRVDLVQWRDREQLTGRVARVDKFDRVIYIVPAIDPLRSFSQAKIIDPAIGISMLKEKGKSRPEVPEKTRILTKLWRGGLGMLGASVHQCCRCHQDELTSPIFSCGLCFETWHQSCSDTLLADNGLDPFQKGAEHVSHWPEPPVPHRRVLPHSPCGRAEGEVASFASLCVMCTAYLA